MSDLHETSALTQDLILKHFVPSFFVLVITCCRLIRSVFCCLVPTFIMFFVVPGYKITCPVCFWRVLVLLAWACTPGCLLSFFSSSVFSGSLGWLCAVECSSCVFFFLLVSLFLSLVQGMCCSRWLRSTDRSKCSSRRWLVFWAQRVLSCAAQHLL